MAKRKQPETQAISPPPVPESQTVPVAEGIAQVPSRSPAQVFAGQRRHKVISSEDGEQLKTLLAKSGLKVQVRAGAGYEMITIEWGRVVVEK